MEIRIKTPSRLHLTLIDLNGQLGRIDGGLGITLNEPNFELIIHDKNSNDEIGRLIQELSENKYSDSTEKLNITSMIHTSLGDIVLKDNSNELFHPNGKNNSRELLNIISEVTNNFVTNLTEKYGDLKTDQFPIQITIIESVSAHMGLGSKTQISLAIAKGLSKILNMNLTISELTELVNRGGTSGIGYRSFNEGGFILDCGHNFGKNLEKETFLPSSASKAKPARTIVRYDFPQKWKILLSILNVPAGASNIEEVNIFQKFCPVPLTEVQELSHLILMQTLPGIIEQNLTIFGNSIIKFQNLGFKKVEVGLQHQRVKDLMEFQRDNGVKCVGMSSFGPTVYSIFESEDEAIMMSNLIKEEFIDVGVKCIITNANNQGISMEIKEN